MSFFSSLRANLAPCNRLHECHSHMTGVRHGELLGNPLLHSDWLRGRRLKIPDWLVIFGLGTTWSLNVFFFFCCVDVLLGIVTA